MLIGILGSGVMQSLRVWRPGLDGWLCGAVALAAIHGRQADACKALLSGYLMSVAYTLAVFAWFGSAVGSYIEIGEAAGFAAFAAGSTAVSAADHRFCWRGI